MSASHVVRGEGPRARHRGALWKEWLPRAALRTSYEFLADTARQVGRRVKGGHKHTNDVRSMVALLYMESQKDAIHKAMSSAQVHPHNWVVYSLMFDESKFVLKTTGESTLCQSVLTAHAMLHYEDKAMHVSSHEVVYAPVVVERATADNLLAGLTSRHPAPLASLLESGLFGCLQVSTDAASTNYKIVKHWAESLAPHILVLWVRCLQHQAALAMSSMSRLLDLVGPLFCLVRLLHSGHHMRQLRRHIHTIIDENLVWEIKERPDPVDRERLHRLLEWCHWDGLASRRDGDGISTCCEVRRAEANELEACFTGDITSDLIIHHCPEGCCQSRQAAVERCTNAFMAPLERRLQVPSLNRWLQLSPVVALICVLCAIHRLLPRGELAFTNLAGGADDEEDPADVEARAVGAPQSMGAERVTDSRRQRKAREWLATTSTLSTLLIWVSVGRLVMVIHYELFQCGTLNRTDKDGKTALQKCIDMMKSRPLRILCKLAKSLDVGTAEHQEIWPLFESFLGPINATGRNLAALCTAAVHRAVGNLWRRFVVRLRSWPWRLSLLLSDQLSHDEKVAIAEEFIAARRCCLDPYFGAKLRELVSEAHDLLLAPVLRFLAACFTKAVAATTHCEDQFAHLRQYLQRSQRATHMASAAAYHMLLESRRIHKAWYESLPIEKRKRQIDLCRQKTRAGACRPIWTQSKRRRAGGSRITCANAYVKARAPILRATTPVDPLVPKSLRAKNIMKQIFSEWLAMSPRERRQWVRKRNRGREEAKQRIDPLQAFVDACQDGSSYSGGGLWAFHDLEWPLAEERLDKATRDHEGACSFVKSCSGRWVTATGKAIPGDNVIPEKIHARVPCPA